MSEKGSKETFSLVEDQKEAEPPFSDEGAALILLLKGQASLKSLFKRLKFESS